MDFNILGVGPAEMVLIFLVALIFLGPKRMMSWTYTAGKYTARFRAQFSEMMASIRKEFEAAEIDLPKDLKVPKVPRGRFDIVKEANKLVSAELNKPASGAASSAAAGVTAAAKPDSENGNTPAPQATNQGTSPATGENQNDAEARYDAWLPK